ncbi:MAG: ThuA domain-containing protein [Pirellulales bacterium]
MNAAMTAMAMSAAMAGAILSLGAAREAGADEEAGRFSLRLRRQTPRPAAAGRFALEEREETWKASETAVIVCDVWDYHHCLNAVRRLEEFGPRLNAVLTEARRRGATIIHAPSDCMPAYEGHPARRRAQAAPAAKHSPPDVELWCSKIPAEEQASYPIDQSDGGEDDDPREHAEWAAKLKSLGRNPNLPWQRQSDLITIDSERDYLSDRGDEVWNVLESRGIRHVILTGVHTNMCVLGRPFGLRQMARGGKNVVLMRDMTDCMYNPARWPYVSHYAGNDLIISHVERYVCPTVTSDQILGGQPFQFAKDARPRLALLIAEEGYQTDATLPTWVRERLSSSFQVDAYLGSGVDRRLALDDVDVLLLSVRRKALHPEAMAALRRFVAAGKPVVGIRTASHAFALKEPTPADREVWPEFDVQVFGAAYQGHPAGVEATELQWATDAARRHPLAAGMADLHWRRPGALYDFKPLAPGAVPLWIAKGPEGTTQPAAWTYERPGGGKAFYTSLGEVADFERPEFVDLLTRAVRWASGRPRMATEAEGDSANSMGAVWSRHWTSVPVPSSWGEATQQPADAKSTTVWYRGVVKIAKSPASDAAVLTLATPPADAQVWWNGRPLTAVAAAGGCQFETSLAAAERGEANLIVVRLQNQRRDGGLATAPQLRVGDKSWTLQGRWQLRLGDDPSWSNMPLPAKFGAATDIVFDASR